MPSHQTVFVLINLLVGVAFAAELILHRQKSPNRRFIALCFIYAVLFVLTY